MNNEIIKYRDICEKAKEKQSEIGAINAALYNNLKNLESICFALSNKDPFSIENTYDYTIDDVPTLKKICKHLDTQSCEIEKKYIEAKEDYHAAVHVLVNLMCAPETDTDGK